MFGTSFVASFGKGCSLCPPRHPFPYGSTKTFLNGSRRRAPGTKRASIQFSAPSGMRRSKNLFRLGILSVPRFARPAVEALVDVVAQLLELGSAQAVLLVHQTQRLTHDFAVRTWYRPDATLDRTSSSSCGVRLTFMPTGDLLARGSAPIISRYVNDGQRRCVGGRETEAQEIRISCRSMRRVVPEREEQGALEQKAIRMAQRSDPAQKAIQREAVHDEVVVVATAPARFSSRATMETRGSAVMRRRSRGTVGSPSRRD